MSTPCLLFHGRPVVLLVMWMESQVIPTTAGLGRRCCMRWAMVVARLRLLRRGILRSRSTEARSLHRSHLVGEAGALKRASSRPTAWALPEWTRAEVEVSLPGLAWALRPQLDGEQLLVVLSVDGALCQLRAAR